jgi:hypothetical protein
MDQGPTPHPGAAKGWPAPWGGAAASWHPSVSALEKIETLAFVSSNSENIFCVAFLKHKNSRNRELALWRLVNSLVLENA